MSAREDRWVRRQDDETTGHHALAGPVNGCIFGAAGAEAKRSMAVVAAHSSMQREVLLLVMQSSG